jgi:hypothetical protein
VYISQQKALENKMNCINHIILTFSYDDIKYDIERNRLKWYGHVMRMADERIPKRMLEMKLGEEDQEAGQEPGGWTK